MDIRMQQLTRQVALLACIGLAAPVFAADADQATAAQAQQALVAQMGDAAKDLSVTVDHGVARLSGWATRPAQVNQARYIVSRVAGVEKSYSSWVHTWTSTDRL